MHNKQLHQANLFNLALRSYIWNSASGIHATPLFRRSLLLNIEFLYYSRVSILFFSHPKGLFPSSPSITLTILPPIMSYILSPCNLPPSITWSRCHGTRRKTRHGAVHQETKNEVVARHIRIESAKHRGVLTYPTWRCKITFLWTTFSFIKPRVISNGRALWKRPSSGRATIPMSFGTVRRINLSIGASSI